MEMLVVVLSLVVLLVAVLIMTMMLSVMFVLDADNECTVGVIVDNNDCVFANVADSGCCCQERGQTSFFKKDSAAFLRFLFYVLQFIIKHD